MFAQVVIGPPGSGKTTYCDGMSQFLKAVGRNVAIVNLDPANDVLPYKPDIDISELITLEEVMENFSLGPNGGLMYCMEFLEENIDWLLKRLYELKDQYLLIDCPGQVELYTHHSSIRNVLATLQKADFRLAAVHLVDSHYCSDAGKFIAVLLTSLSTMLQLELPHVNVLSKVDLVEKFGKLAFNLEYYTEVLNLSYLLEDLDVDPFLAKFKKLNEAMVGLVEDYSLVTFQPLNINDKKTVHKVLMAVDRANGYIFGAQEEGSIQNYLCSAMSSEDHASHIQEVEELYINKQCS